MATAFQTPIDCHPSGLELHLHFGVCLNKFHICTTLKGQKGKTFNSDYYIESLEGLKDETVQKIIIFENNENDKLHKLGFDLHAALFLSNLLRLFPLLRHRYEERQYYLVIETQRG